MLSTAVDPEPDGKWTLRRGDLYIPRRRNPVLKDEARCTLPERYKGVRELRPIRFETMIRLAYTVLHTLVKTSRGAPGGRRMVLDTEGNIIATRVGACWTGRCCTSCAFGPFLETTSYRCSERRATSTALLASQPSYALRDEWRRTFVQIRNTAAVAGYCIRRLNT